MNRLISTMLFLLAALSCTGQDYKDRRSRMVSDQIEGRGIRHTSTLRAMRKVPRHLFVPAEYRKHAYDDTPLPIGYEQTISQPYMVAIMTELINPEATNRVLEVGTGSGYQAAVLAEIVDTVYTIEIVKELGLRTKKLMRDLGYKNVQVTIGDGYNGLETKAPFDAIIVTAAPEEVPPALIRQLKEGGKMVIPVGPVSSLQTLRLLQKRKGKLISKDVSAVRFVPFTREKE